MRASRPWPPSSAPPWPSAATGSSCSTATRSAPTSARAWLPARRPRHQHRPHRLCRRQAVQARGGRAGGGHLPLPGGPRPGPHQVDNFVEVTWPRRVDLRRARRQGPVRQGPGRRDQELHRRVRPLRAAGDPEIVLHRGRERRRLGPPGDRLAGGQPAHHPHRPLRDDPGRPARPHLASDGGDRPEELVAAGRGRGGDLAVTDHDTVAAVAEARAAGERLGSRCWPAARSPPPSGTGSSTCCCTARACSSRTWPTPSRWPAGPGRAQPGHRRAAGASAGSATPTPSRSPGQCACRGPTSPGRWSPGVVADVAEAFDRYLSSGRPAYVPAPSVSLTDAVAIAAKAGGWPCWPTRAGWPTPSATGWWARPWRSTGRGLALPARRRPAPVPGRPGRAARPAGHRRVRLRPAQAGRARRHGPGRQRERPRRAAGRLRDRLASAGPG